MERVLEANRCAGKGWSSISDDILRNFLQRLCFSDQIRAVATCKSWAIHIPRRTDHHLLWLIHQICYDQAAWEARRQVVLKITLYEPGNPNPHTARNAIDDFPTDGFENIQPWYRPRILESKLGWLLVAIMDLEHPRRRSRLVLYTPFGNNSTRNHVLPDFSGIVFLDERVCGATFSSPPTSADCIVFVCVKNLNRSGGANEIRIWRVGQDRWSRHPILLVDTDEQLTTRWVITSTAYVAGNLYCLFQSGGLLAFNTSNGVYELVRPELENTTVNNLKVLVESNGELLLLVFKLVGKVQSSDYNREGCSVYGYDVSTNIWVRKLKLHDQAVFLSSFRHATLVQFPATQMLSCGQAYGGLVTDGLIQEFRYDFPLDGDTDLYCICATYEPNNGGKDCMWLSYPCFD